MSARSLLFYAFLTFPLLAQTPFVRAVGQATVSAQPDQAIITFSVVTQATTAQEAASANATRADALIAQLKLLLGAAADIKTISYTLNPNYNYTTNGGTPLLTGYTASNTIRAATSDLSIIGKVIDTGITAGANQVQSLQFALKDDAAAKAQALKAATIQAKSHADAMASGAGLHTGSFRSIEEGAVYQITAAADRTATAAITTPIITGLVTVSATVTVEVTLIP